MLTVPTSTGEMRAGCATFSHSAMSQHPHPATEPLKPNKPCVTNNSIVSRARRGERINRNNVSEKTIRGPGSCAQVELGHAPFFSLPHYGSVFARETASAARDERASECVDGGQCVDCVARRPVCHATGPMRSLSGTSQPQMLTAVTHRLSGASSTTSAASRTSTSAASRRSTRGAGRSF